MIKYEAHSFGAYGRIVINGEFVYTLNLAGAEAIANELNSALSKHQTLSARLLVESSKLVKAQDKLAELKAVGIEKTTADSFNMDFRHNSND